MLTYNQAGYGRPKNEYELYTLLDSYLFSKYPNLLRQKKFDTGCIIDYFNFEKGGTPLLIEVKPWFLRISDMEQLLKYYVHATELWGLNKFILQAIAGGIEPQRQKILEKLGIEVALSKDIIGR